MKLKILLTVNMKKEIYFRYFLYQFIFKFVIILNEI